MALYEIQLAGSIESKLSSAQLEKLHLVVFVAQSLRLVLSSQIEIIIV